MGPAIIAEIIVIRPCICFLVQCIDMEIKVTLSSEMNIYVENVPLSTTEEELRQLFTPYGTVESVFLVKDKQSGMPKGSAYVVMPSDAEAEQAIAGLEGSEYCGQELRVVEAQAEDFPSDDYW